MFLIQVVYSSLKNFAWIFVQLTHYTEHTHTFWGLLHVSVEQYAWNKGLPGKRVAVRCRDDFIDSTEIESTVKVCTDGCEKNEHFEQYHSNSLQYVKYNSNEWFC